MRSVNKVILIGNLTRDPELKTTTSGQSIVTFGLATNRQWTTSAAERRASAEFHECVAWAKLAEICKNYLRKGMLIYVEGYLKTRSWDMEDGTRRFRTEIVLQDMIILEKRKGEGEGEFDNYEGGEGFAEMDAAPMMAEAAPSEEMAPAAAPIAPATASSDDGRLAADINDDNLF